MSVKKSAKKAPAKKAAAKVEAPAFVNFMSSKEEISEFKIHGYRARRCDKPGHIIFKIPAEEAEQFAKHPHVRSGRIIRVED